jgi:hypothetical protein
MPGVGKTVLAVHLAHRLAEEYPDGQLYLDLHGLDAEQEATTPAAALDALLEASPAATTGSGISVRSPVEGAIVLPDAESFDAACTKSSQLSA